MHESVQCSTTMPTLVAACWMLGWQGSSSFITRSRSCPRRSLALPSRGGSKVDCTARELPLLTYYHPRTNSYLQSTGSVLHYKDPLRTVWTKKLTARDQDTRQSRLWRSKSRFIRASSGLGASQMAPAKKMVSMPILQEGVFRFDASEGARKQAHPSVSFVEREIRETPLKIENGAPHEPAFIPQCRIENGVQTITMKFPAGTSFYGTGEVSGPLERTGRRIFGWNSDAWGYGPSTTALYQTHPWVLAVLPDGTALGVLADTTRRSEVDLRKDCTIRLAATASYPVITFGPYQSPEAVLRVLSTATGTLAMPPKWSIGYQQCRWSYETTERVKEVVSTFRAKKLPCDVIWMDIDYMDGFRCFTFHPETFSEPSDLSQFLHDEGFKGVWMLDPGIKQEKGYFAYDSGTTEGIWVLQNNGKPYVGEVWPGPVVFPDYTQEKARQWWAKLVKEFVSVGVDGIWNDMNEPAVFQSLSKTMPDNNIHVGDKELGGRQNHVHYHNVYGMLMARATYEGMLLANPRKRPFVLTRAGFMGSQRYAATWTGDNLSNWVHLQMSIPMALNLSLSGQPFSGPDIGGFAGDATPKLYARWMGIGALLPFSRGHSEQGTAAHEPWSFGKECEEVVQLALGRRYRLLPHLYTLVYKAHTTGVPIMTPLFFSDPKDPKLRKVDDSFLLGPVLVAASTDPRKKADPKRTILPNGIWQQFDFNDQHNDLPLLYLQGGAIVPTGPVVQHTGELDGSSPLTLLIALDKTGNAEGILYEDDGDGFEFQKGEFLLTHYQAQFVSKSSNPDDGGKVTIGVQKSEGSWSRPERALKIRILIGDGAEVVGEGVDGEELTIDFPQASEIQKLRSTRLQQDLSMTEKENGVSDEVDYDTLESTAGVPQKLVELKSGEWLLNIAPWVGGRIINMIHTPTNFEWLQGRVEKGAYEEYSGVEYRSPGCTEEYNVIKKELTESAGSHGITLEGDIGGGLAMVRHIEIPSDSPKVLQIRSSIEARSVGAGSGGFSRLVCLRVHPTFIVANPEKASVQFTAVDGTKREIICDKPGEIFLRGSDRPNKEWTLIDKESGSSLVNRFQLEEVATCLIHWAPGVCNLELWSAERPVSKDTPIIVSHEYEFKPFTEK
ncbi:unnamed protein product [Calypogeia fissa]